MEKEGLKGKIIGVLERSKLGSMATIKEGKPWVRYMAIHYREGLILFTTSFAGSRKIEQIKKDKNVHVAMGGDPGNYQLDYVNIQATARVLTDPEMKKKCWRDELGQFFSGPEDPNYVVIEISPQVIEYMGPGAHAPEVYLAD